MSQINETLPRLTESDAKDLSLLHSALERGLRIIRREITLLETGHVNFETSVADTANPPTSAQLVTAIGDPAVLGDGFLAVVDDAGAATNCYLCWTASDAWWIATGTKAT